jgi:hypothetical protein
LENTRSLYKRQQHLTHNSLDVDNIGRYKLCFQVGEYTCYAVVFDIRSQQCVLFEKYILPEEEYTLRQRVNAFKQMVETHHLLSVGSWQRINFVVQNQTFSFIPAEFFDVNNVIDTLRLNAEVDVVDNHVQYSEHFEGELMSIFTTPRGFSDWLEELYPSSTIVYSHYTGTFLEGVLKKKIAFDKKKLHILIQEKTMTVLILNQYGLEFINVFHVEQPQDCLYFILSSVKSLGLKQEDLEVIFYGDILENSLTVGLLSRYISKISFSDSPEGLLFGEAFDEELAPHQHFELFSSSFID